MPKITILPYSNKHEKKSYRKVKYQKLNRPPVNREDRIIHYIDEDNFYGFSRDEFTAVSENELGKLWTF